MKCILFVLICFMPRSIFAQMTDSIIVAQQVDTLLQKSLTSMGIQNFEVALQLIEEAKGTAEARFGKMNAIYAACIHAQGRFYLLMGDFTNAEPFCIEAVDIRKKVLGAGNIDYAGSLSNLATLFYYKGDYTKAVYLFLELIEIQAKILGKEHPNYAMALNGLANVYVEIGDYTKAEPLLLEGKGIMAKVLGERHPDYAMFLSNFAAMYGTKGDCAKAEPLFLEAKEIWEKTLGKEDPVYATVLNNLGNLYWEKGDYDKMESLFLEAKEIREKALGKEHPNYALSLYHLASLYFERGDCKKAEPLFLEAIKIQIKVLGKAHIEYANSLTGLAVLYIYKGDFPKADSLYLEVEEIRKKELGDRHVDYARLVYNRAVLYMHQRNYTKAEPLFLESLEIMADNLGKEHRDYAAFLQGLGELYYNSGNYTKAKSRFLEAKKIIIEVLGKEHKDYALSLLDLAILYRKTANIVESSPLFLELNDLIRRLIEKSAAYSSESQMLAYLQTFEDEIAQFHSFAQSHPTIELASACFDDALFYNGFLLENARRLARSVAGADSLTRDTYERWQGCRRRLANEYAKPLAERRYVAEVEAEAEGYEKTLTRNLPAFAGAYTAPRWHDVLNRLQLGEAAIEFIHYPYYTPNPTEDRQYAALVLLPGATSPRLVPLCNQKQLDAVLNKKDPEEEDEDYIKNLYYNLLQGNETPLYQLIWKPIEPLLAGVSKIWYAPAGNLHQINLSAIQPDRSGQTLGDRYQLLAVGSTRQLVNDRPFTSGQDDALIFGDIRYSMDTTAYRGAIASLGTGMPASNLKNDNFQQLEKPAGRSGTRGAAPEEWPELKFSPIEVENLNQLLQKAGFQTRVRRGYEANEEAVKSIASSAGDRSPRILHFSTHGFFFPDPPPSKAGDDLFGSVFKTSEHPLLRSGLILAGANYAWKNQRAFGGFEDGVLTAYEISQMNLAETELVVLSACETGLGDIEGHEGVYGLQRAFKIAGVKYILMSLWEIPDAATSALMTAFYQNYLLDKMPVQDALHAAQHWMREQEAFDNPFYWAGFVLIE